MIQRWACCVVVFLSMATGAAAHEMRPAYLEIQQRDEEQFDVLWKVPARGTEARLSLHLRFSDDVEFVGESVSGFVADSHIQRLRIRRAAGLAGAAISIDGLESTFTDVLLRIEYLQGTGITHRLTADQPTYVVEQSPSLWRVAWTYFVLGVEHILLGIDHLLFVLALLLVVSDGKKLVGTITAFTVAHSITLALATLGVVSVPGPPVEATIALSIVFVCAEIIRGRNGNPGLTARWPWIVSFTFGLLHGFGFAGALRDVGLPMSAIPMALLTFNVGVEVGQLAFVAVLVSLFLLYRRCAPVPSWGYLVPTYGIGCVAAFWVLERTVAFWTS